MQEMTVWLRAAWALASTLVFAAAHADTGDRISRLVQDSARELVEQQAERSGLVNVQVSVTPGPVSKAPPPCAGRIGIEAQDTRSMTRLRFVVTCPGDDGWTRKVTARARVTADVLVLRHEVPAGRPLTDEDVNVEARDVSAMPDAIGDPVDLDNMTLRRTLAAGEVLRKRLLAAAILIKRGDPVRIVARNSGIEVQTAGEALEGGGDGDIVRVRNLSSGTVLRARVTAAGEVEAVSRANP